MSAKKGKMEKIEERKEEIIGYLDFAGPKGILQSRINKRYGRRINSEIILGQLFCDGKIAFFKENKNKKGRPSIIVVHASYAPSVSGSWRRAETAFLRRLIEKREEGQKDG